MPTGTHSTGNSKPGSILREKYPEDGGAQQIINEDDRKEELSSEKPSVSEAKAKRADTNGEQENANNLNGPALDSGQELDNNRLRDENGMKKLNAGDAMYGSFAGDQG